MSIRYLTKCAYEIQCAAHLVDLGAPAAVDILGDTGCVEMRLTEAADLRAWAEWADLPITSSWPRDGYSGRAFVKYTARGELYGVPVELSAYEWGRIVPASSWSCETCGASGGSSAGFVADDEPELAEHECAEVSA